MTAPSRHYVLAAGGTGGHLTPAFALAEALERRGHHVALITDARGASIPGKPDFLTAHVLPAGRFGKNPLRWLGGLAAVMEGRRMALRLFDSFAPSAVVGFGGYPALPALLAARRAGIASVIHEQNAVLGRVNRLLAGGVNAIATSYPDIDRLKEKHLEKVHLVGNPVRAQVLALRDEPFPPFTEDGLLRVLVTGGSQGARVLSQVVPDGLARLPSALRSRLQVTQQCRAEDLDTVRARYAGHGIAAELGTYFEDMAARLADAHLFIGRAGASTIAELTAVEVTTTAASPRLAASWPTKTSIPRLRSRSTEAPSARSEPCTEYPRLCMTSAMPDMPIPPMPTKWIVPISVPTPFIRRLARQRPSTSSGRTDPGSSQASLRSS